MSAARAGAVLGASIEVGLGTSANWRTHRGSSAHHQRHRKFPPATNGSLTRMKVYVAGPLTDTTAVRAVQQAVLAAGHQLSLDWTRGLDVSFAGDYAEDLVLSSKIAADDLDGVLNADAVLVVASQHEGRGMFVELGAALTRATRGDLEHVVVVGHIQHESVFYYHPAVQRVSTIEEWLTMVS